MNKDNSGYILLEIVISMMVFICIFKSVNLFSSLLDKYDDNITNNIELMQQSNEVKDHIYSQMLYCEKLIGIKDIKGRTIFIEDLSENLIEIGSLIYSFEGKQKEIIHSKKYDKVFIKHQGQSSGYEIGAYIDKILIQINKEDGYIDIILKLSNIGSLYEDKIRIYYEDEDMA